MSKPKLQDTLNAFLDELEVTKDVMNSLKQTIIEQDKRVSKRKMEPNMNPLEEWSNGFLTNLQSSEKRNKGILQELTIEHQEQNKTTNENNNNLKRFYIYTMIIAFLVAIVTSAFAINRYFESNKLNEEVVENQQNMHLLLEFIEDEGLVEEFENWNKSE